MNAETTTTIDDLAHEVWAAAQLAPGDGIEDAVRRIAGLIAAALDSQARQIEALTAERDALKHGHRSQHDADSAELRRLCAERDAMRARLDDAKPATTAPGEWVEWLGGSQPVADGARCQVRLEDGDEAIRIAEDWVWEHDEFGANITAYRILP